MSFVPLTRSVAGCDLGVIVLGLPLALINGNGLLQGFDCIFDADNSILQVFIRSHLSASCHHLHLIRSRHAATIAPSVRRPFALGLADVCPQRKQLPAGCFLNRVFDLSIVRHQREADRGELGTAAVFAALPCFDCGTSADAIDLIHQKPRPPVGQVRRAARCRDRAARMNILKQPDFAGADASPERVEVDAKAQGWKRPRRSLGHDRPAVSFDYHNYAIRAGPLQYLESLWDDDWRILALLDPVAVAAGQQHCEGYDGQYAHALISPFLPPHSNMAGKTSISGTKNPAPTGSGAKSREKRHESFAASEAYDISNRQVVAIPTQRREKASPKERMVAGKIAAPYPTDDPRNN